MKFKLACGKINNAKMKSVNFFIIVNRDVKENPKKNTSRLSCFHTKFMSEEIKRKEEKLIDQGLRKMILMC